MNAQFMERAIQLAIENVRSGRGGPFAALVVRAGGVLATGTNVVTSSNDPTAHAEIVAIRAACAALGTFQLEGCDLYATCEPCPMCLGAIYWARLARYYYGNTRADAARIGFDDARIYQELARLPEERAVVGVRLLPHEAAEAFKEWVHAPVKVPY